MIDFHKLKIWQRSLALAVEVAAATKGRARYGPAGLVAQLTRACNSVHANIAEGAGQATPLQIARFLDVSIGSLNEAESHLQEAKAVHLVLPGKANAFIEEISALRRMTLSYKRYILRNEH
jgi:four helix bundle protein